MLACIWAAILAPPHGDVERGRGAKENPNDPSASRTKPEWADMHCTSVARPLAPQCGRSRRWWRWKRQALLRRGTKRRQAWCTGWRRWRCCNLKIEFCCGRRRSLKRSIRANRLRHCRWKLDNLTAELLAVQRSCGGSYRQKLLRTGAVAHLRLSIWLKLGLHRQHRSLSVSCVRMCHHRCCRDSGHWWHHALCHGPICKARHVVGWRGRMLVHPAVLCGSSRNITSVCTVGQRRRMHGARWPTQHGDISPLLRLVAAFALVVLVVAKLTVVAVLAAAAREEAAPSTSTKGVALRAYGRMQCPKRRARDMRRELNGTRGALVVRAGILVVLLSIERASPQDG